MKPRGDTSKRFPQKNAAGEYQCQECGKERPKGVLPRAWCPECLEAYKVRAWPRHAAKTAAKRDQGVCMQCGVDTAKLKTWLKSLPDIYAYWAWQREHGKASISGREDRYTKHTGASGHILGRHRSRAIVWLSRLWGVRLTTMSHLYEIDHIVPVAEGGGGCYIENLRTLCRRCHRIESAALNNRLRKRPSKGVGRGF